MIQQGKTRHDMTRQDKTRQDKTRQDKTRQDRTKQDKARQDKARQDRARQPGARQDKAAWGKTGQSTMQHAIVDDLVCKCQLGNLVLEGVLHSAAQELCWHHDVGGRQLDGRRLCQ